MGMPIKPRLCFTINPRRTLSEIRSFKELLANKIYHGIEIFYPYDESPLQKEEYQRGIKELLEEKPEVVLHLPFGKENDLCNLLTYQETLMRLIDALDYGKSFGVKKYTLHLGYLQGERSLLLKHLITPLNILCKASDGLIMIENMPRESELGYSPEEIKSLIDQVNKKNLGFIYDTGHGNISSYSLQDYFTILKKHLQHIHLNDNKGFIDEHKPIGYGTVDFKQLLSLNSDYTGLYCLEIIYQTVLDLQEYAKSFNNLLENK